MRGKRTRGKTRRTLVFVLVALLVAGLVPPGTTFALADEVAIELGSGAAAEPKGVLVEGIEVLSPDGQEQDVEGDIALVDPDVLVEPDPAPDDNPADSDVVQYSGMSVSNPRVVADSLMTAGQVTTWDCVWFGSYPQSEVAPSDAEYDCLQNASWDAKGDTTIGSTKYCRISGNDTTYNGNWSEDGYGSAIYRYFRYDPIKWRVLKVSGTTVLVVADKALDSQLYNANRTDVTWETSSIRSWLNGYGASSNQPGTDFSGKSFIGAAFSSNEMSAILQTNVVNKDSLYGWHGTAGGNDTEDEVFLLSETEVCDMSYGFAGEYRIYDEARRCTMSAYARAMGGSCSRGSCWWWLRSPGGYADCAAVVGFGGYGNSANGNDVDVYRGNAVRPALNLNLTSSHTQAAGTVSSNGDVCELPPAQSSTEITSVSLDVTTYIYDGKAKEPATTVRAGDVIVPASGYDVAYEGNVDVGTATITVTGKGDYKGTATGTFQIAPKAVTVKADDKSKTYGQDDPELTATVSGTVGTDKVDYTLSRAEGQDAGTYAVNPEGAAAQGNYAVTFQPGTLTIAKATPSLGAVSASRAGCDLDVSKVVLSRTDESVAGTLSLDATELRHGKGDYGWAFTPQDATNYKAVTGTVEITVPDHQASPATDQNAVTSTCAEAGSHDEVTCCTACGAELSRVHKTDAALGHDYQTTIVDPTWDVAGYTLHKCSRCNDEHQTDQVPSLRDQALAVARPVVEAIAALPSAGALALVDEAAVVSARSAYDGLTKQQQGLVSNYDKLVSVEARLAELRAEAARVDLSSATVSAPKQTYSGEAMTPTVTVTLNGTKLAASYYDVKYDRNTNAGTATVTVTGKGRYKGTATGTFAIARKAVTVRADDKSKAYGQADPKLTATVTGTVGADTVAYTLSRAKGQNAGTYTITANGAATQGNYAVTFQSGKFTIKKADQTITASDKTVAMGKTVSIDAQASGSGALSYKTSDAEVATVDACGVVSPAKVGEATITVKAAATANHKVATKAITVTVVKGAQPMVVKVTAKTVKASAVKKKAVTVATISVTEAQGTVKYARVAKGSAAALSVNAKTGKVTVRKGTKKGTYKIKVTVTAAGNGNWNKGSKTVTCTVKVK